MESSHRPYIFFRYLIPCRWGNSKFQILCRPPVSVSTQTQTHHKNTYSCRKVNKAERKMQRCKKGESISLSAIRSSMVNKKREGERTLKEAIISRKVNIVRRCCPDTFVVRTFETKRVSKQVKKCQDTMFTISCSPSATSGFDLSLLYILQCHKHNALSRSFKGPSVTGSGGERSNIHF